jgi:hypothetical protein
MARSPIDENSVHGIVLEGDPSGTALPWKGNDTNGAAYVELISPNGDSVIDDTNDAVKVNIVAGSSSGIQYTDGGVPPAHPVGNTVEWSDGSNWQTVSTAKPLPVTASIDTTGLATSTGQTTGNNSLSSIDTKTPALGQALSASSVPIVLTAAQIITLTPPAAITGFATSANQLPDGHNVTIDNSNGASAVNIQDGGNTITVDGTVTANISGSISNTSFASTIADGADVTLGAKADAKNTATDNTAITIMQVLKEISYMEQTPASRAVTNADITSCKTALELLDNSVDGNYLNTNMNIAGTDVVGGAGAVAAGVQRVTLASDDPAVIALQLIDNAVSGAGFNITQVNGETIDVGAGSEAAAIRVTLPTDGTGVVKLGAGTSEIGKLATGTANIGDVDVLSITNASINGPGVPVIDSYSKVAINLAAGANQVLVSSAANKQIWVYGFGFTVNVAGTISFQDEDDTTITGIMPIATNGGMVNAPSGNFAMPIWKLATDKDLEVDIVTSEMDGWLCYALVSV